MPLLEQRCEFALEDLALLFEALGCEDFSGVAAVHPRQQMARTNEGTQQAVPIKIGAEIANPSTTEQIARFPIASRRLIEMWPDIVLVGTHVLARIGLGKAAALLAYRTIYFLLPLLLSILLLVGFEVGRRGASPTEALVTKARSAAMFKA